MATVEASACADVSAAKVPAGAEVTAAVEPWVTVEAGSTTPAATVSIAISAAPSTAPGGVAEEGRRADRWAVVTRSDAPADDRRGQANPDVHATGLGGGVIEAGTKANHGGKGQSCKCSHDGLLLEEGE
jgi:hypothetical protein